MTKPLLLLLATICLAFSLSAESHEPQIAATILTVPVPDLYPKIVRASVQTFPGMDLSTWSLMFAVMTGDPGLRSLDQDLPLGGFLYHEDDRLSWAGLVSLPFDSPLRFTLPNLQLAFTGGEGLSLLHPQGDTPPAEWVDAMNLEEAPRADLEVDFVPEVWAPYVGNLSSPLLIGLFNLLGPPEEATARTDFADQIVGLLIRELSHLENATARIFLRPEGLRLTMALEVEDESLFQPLFATPEKALVDRRFGSTTFRLVPEAATGFLSRVGRSLEMEGSCLDSLPEAILDPEAAIDCEGLAGSSAAAWEKAFQPQGAETDPGSSSKTSFPGTVLTAAATPFPDAPGWNAVLTAREGRGVLTVDVPYALIQRYLSPPAETVPAP